MVLTVRGGWCRGGGGGGDGGEEGGELRRPLGHKKDVKLKLLEKHQANASGVHSMQSERRLGSVQRPHSNDDTHNSAHCNWERSH